MPESEIPQNPVIEQLRAAVEEAGYEAMGPAATALYTVAQDVVREHDHQIAAIRLAMSMPRPTAQQVREQLFAGHERGIDYGGAHQPNSINVSVQGGQGGRGGTFFAGGSGDGGHGAPVGQGGRGGGGGYGPGGWHPVTFGTDEPAQVSPEPIEGTPDP